MAILSFEVGKCQYLGPWAINEKTKDTLLSQTNKKSKDTLLSQTLKVILFVAQEPRYGHCIIFHVFLFDATL